MLLLYGATIFLITFILSFILTGKILSYVSVNNLLDHPNQRSLHQSPVPRGGGVSIVLLVIICLIALWILNFLETKTLSAFLIGGIIIFLTGLIDDIQSLPALAKGVSYCFASIWGVFWLTNGMGYGNSVDMLNVFIWGLGVTWMVNLYNFMDGSDGFAGIQALFAGIVLICLSFISGNEIIYYLMLVVGASSLGFLAYNFPPARLFMGDSGSCFLGFIFGLSGYYCHLTGAIAIQVWLILFSVFICDSSLTLMMRVITGRKWYEAHREHAYQKYILIVDSHKKLIGSFTILHIFLILPGILVALTYPDLSWHTVIFCFLILTALWVIIQFQYGNKGRTS